ncbi:MAG: hypothetical protein Q8M92_09350 [Candidatus Subteraquimicrobiales bacterium]|nr:hypothetical protein [Candidatus Subteraquimicrobiales bacterium]
MYDSKNKKVAKRGGSVAGIMRKDIEKRLGKSMISRDNFKKLNSRKMLK